MARRDTFSCRWIAAIYFTQSESMRNHVHRNLACDMKPRPCLKNEHCILQMNERRTFTVVCCRSPPHPNSHVLSKQPWLEKGRGEGAALARGPVLLAPPFSASRAANGGPHPTSLRRKLFLH